MATEKSELIKIFLFNQAVVVHAFNPSTQEAKADRSLSSRLAWSTRASIRTGSKATEKPCLEKQNKTKQRKKFPYLLLSSFPSHFPKILSKNVCMCIMSFARIF